MPCIARRLGTLTVLAWLLALGPAPAVAATVDAFVSQLGALFKGAGFLEPVIDISENEERLNLSIQAAGPIDHSITNDSGRFRKQAKLDFWNITLVFSAIDGPQRRPDSLTAGATVWHDIVDGKPHPSDRKESDDFSFDQTILDYRTQRVRFGDRVAHPRRHSDRVFDGLFAVTVLPGQQRIQGWNFRFKVEHLPRPVPLPAGAPLAMASLLLLGGIARRRSDP